MYICITTKIWIYVWKCITIFEKKKCIRKEVLTLDDQKNHPKMMKWYKKVIQCDVFIYFSVLHIIGNFWILYQALSFYLFHIKQEKSEKAVYCLMICIVVAMACSVFTMLVCYVQKLLRNWIELFYFNFQQNFQQKYQQTLYVDIFMFH